MRKAAVLFMILASLIFYTFAVTAPASADPGGNNGDVKIHRTGTAVSDHRDEPQVCPFYIDGFNFDAGSRGTWRIERWAPSGSGVASSGAWGPADADGNWHTSDQTLPDGHYKLFVQQTTPAAPGGDKQKVFWVDCAPTATATPVPTATATPVVTPSATPIVTPTATATPIVTPTATPVATPSASPLTNGNGTGNGNGNTGTGNGNTGGGTDTGTTGTTGGNGQAVAGFQAPPSGSNAVGAVTPILELPGGSNQLPPTGTVLGVEATASGTVQGVQSAPVAGVQGLPSTSTGSAPQIPLGQIGLGLMVIGGAVLRRRASRA